MNRISVPLEQSEITALVRLARDERRHPREQAAWLIRDGLQRAGLLPAESQVVLSEQSRPVQNEV